MRLIDADAYRAEIKQRQDACAEWRDEAKACCDTELFVRADGSLSAFIEAKLTLDKIPTIDAVPVVRCKDCIYWEEIECSEYGACNRAMDIQPHGTVYCAFGERKDGDA